MKSGKEILFSCVTAIGLLIVFSYVVPIFDAWSSCKLVQASRGYGEYNLIEFSKDNAVDRPGSLLNKLLDRNFVECSFSYNNKIKVVRTSTDNLRGGMYE